MTQFWIAFASVFVVVSPLGAVPTFAALTRGRSAAEVRDIARRGAVVGAGVLVAFTLLGPSLLATLGVSPPAFQVAGGTLLFLTALEMLRGKASACSCGPGDVEAARQRDDIAIVPVAIPLLAGPGSMATVMSLVSADPSAGSIVAIVAAIAVTFLLAYPILRSATLLQRVLGTSVLTVVQRVLGLVLAALSIQTAVVALSVLFGGAVA
jgi:multiple antibiotic resistance protein